MKKIITALIIVLFVSSVCFANSNIDITIVPNEFTDSSWNKLAPDIKHAWLVSKNSGNMSDKYTCLIRIREPADMGDKSFLLDKGVELVGAATFFGPISKGIISAKDLPDVANLEFVQRIGLVR